MAEIAVHDDDVTPDAAHGAAKTEERKSGAARIVGVVEFVAEDLIFDGTRAYAVVKNGTGGVRTLLVGSSAFNRWAVAAVRAVTNGKVIVTADALKTARLGLEAKAEHDGGIRPAPTIRVAEIPDGILIDLGDDAWRCIKVTAHGWEVIPHPANGPYFMRPPLMAPLPVPLPKGKRNGVGIKSLWKYILIPRTDQRFLKLVGLLFKFNPRGPYPLEAFGGEQGSAKTVSMKADKSLDGVQGTRLGPSPQDRGSGPPSRSVCSADVALY